MTRPDRSRLQFRKSSYSGTGGCIEFARYGGSFAVRDSKETDGPILFGFSPEDVRSFVKDVRNDKF